MGVIDSVDAMILGANTYAQAKDYWPYADEQGEYGEKLNNLTKFVASSKLDDAPCGDFPAATVTRDPAATIRELEEQSGKNIWLWGSSSLMHALLDAGLVDEVQMRVCPGVTRQGTAHQHQPADDRTHRCRAPNPGKRPPFPPTRSCLGPPRPPGPGARDGCSGLCGFLRQQRPMPLPRTVFRGTPTRR
ncbi:dihydrofolate reductase family protein [Nocardia sp. NBC_00565]|uniref:dihydrofolate reductase family protein n=1 Tax=Nocardia sp. NBC_00565 TaxID=2975993 RepID=UPI002E807B30|nr:dihydrofolate reductase family protein [Nocardia sp. NBC_00565]WUC06734.1 dihydrofolate reductase family protein [Nocardia sp. NBC_00565]